MSMSRTVAKEKDQLNMVSGDIARGILRYTMPLILGNLFQSMYNLIDSAVVGNYVGTQALAAVGTAGLPVQLVQALFLGLGTGANILTAQSCGAGDLQTRNRIVGTTRMFLIISAVPLTILGITLILPMLHWMQVPDGVLPLSAKYLLVVYLGIPANLGCQLNSSILRGMGNSRMPTRFLIAATVVNTILDLVFVVILKAGVIGVAAATVIAQYLSLVYSEIYCRWFWRGTYKSTAIHWDLMIQMAQLGIPMGLTTCITTVGHMIFRANINGFGEVYLAGYIASSKIDSVVFHVLVSFAVAASVFAGQNLGANQYARLRDGLKKLLLLVVGSNLILCSLILAAGRPLIAVFDPNPEVIEAGVSIFRWMMPFYWTYAAAYTLNYFMVGAGRVKIHTASNLLMFFGVRIPASFLLVRLGEWDMLFLAYPISWLAMLIVSHVYFLRNRKRILGYSER